jgi:transcriptional regulator with XRE-family HTH domain
MTSSNFKTWRKSLGLSQKRAADALGLKNRIVQYYEKGERDGDKVKIPKHVRLACYALSVGVADYHGPAETRPERPRRPASSAASAKQTRNSTPPCNEA